MNQQQFAVVEGNTPSRGGADTGGEKSIELLTALGSALSDPIRVRMLKLLVAATVEGRGCCNLPNLGVPADAEEKGIGVCVCEFEQYFGMGQSKVSYHLRKLKGAGLVREEKRGKWCFYSLDREAATQLLNELAGQLELGLART
jgi:ArsR family transcriptional regulator, arsenate/arsenite/antimonite-responsive transcriptional repressor